MTTPDHTDSPVSNNGRGLKPHADDAAHRPARDSPVSNNGRGLKQVVDDPVELADRDSPVSNNGRGLKQLAASSQLGLNRGFAR